MDLLIRYLEDDKVFWELDGVEGVCEIFSDEVIDTYLRSDYFQLKPYILPAVTFEVQKWINEKPERDKQFAESEAKADKIRSAWDEWEETNGEFRHAVPSMGCAPDEVAVEGRCILFDFDEYGYGHGTAYTCLKLENPTWGKVMTTFDMSIIVTGDEHHCFLEGLIEVDPADHPKVFANTYIAPGTKVFRFATGS